MNCTLKKHGLGEGETASCRLKSKLEWNAFQSNTKKHATSANTGGGANEDHITDEFTVIILFFNFNVKFIVFSVKREDIRYTKDHYWVAPLKGNEFKVGLSDYAQDNYGDVVHVEIAKLDEHVDRDGKYY